MQGYDYWNSNNGHLKNYKAKKPMKNLDVPLEIVRERDRERMVVRFGRFSKCLIKAYIWGRWFPQSSLANWKLEYYQLLNQNPQHHPHKLFLCLFYNMSHNLSKYICTQTRNVSRFSFRSIETLDRKAIKLSLYLQRCDQSTWLSTIFELVHTYGLHKEGNKKMTTFGLKEKGTVSNLLQQKIKAYYEKQYTLLDS